MEEFKVDLSSLPQNRRLGVSGMMRVRNDAEFIEACVSSCIDALDELVIVYNNCTDNSPAVIESMRKRYPEKIKVYHYQPEIMAWNLNSVQVKNILTNVIPSENTLAGYYNYALSKTSCKYVMKIDADQIYYSPLLKILCDCYRANPLNIRLGIKGYINLYYTKLLMAIARRYNLNIGLLGNKKHLMKYQKNLIKYLKKKKVVVTLSGVNSVIKDAEIYVTLGKYLPEGVNILGPFNGEGDHLIFEVDQSTYFVPYRDINYNRLIGGKENIIERFNNNKRTWPVISPLWIHLNGCRKDSYNKNLEYIAKYKDRYILLKDFINWDYDRKASSIDEEVFPIQRRITFRWTFEGLTDKFVDHYKDISKKLTMSLFKIKSIGSGIKCLN